MIKRTMVILMVILLMGCNEQVKQVSRSEFLLDTYVETTLFGIKDEVVLDDIYDEVRRLEDLLSLYKEGSDLYKLKQANSQPIEVSKETLEIIQKASEYTVMSDGLFDVTLGPLIDLWGITSESPRVPSNDEIEKALSLTGMDKLQIDGNRITLEKDMYMNFGGIAKGYITDVIVNEAKIHGAQGGIFNFGGNIYVMGNKPDGSNFNVGIQRPGDDRNDYFAIFRGTDKSIVTSGVYERFFEYENKQYHHILDPQTGYPAETDLVSVTIISDTCFEGDVLSTTVLLLGLDDAKSLMASLENVGAILVTDDHRVYMTSNLAEHVTIVDDELLVEIID